VNLLRKAYLLLALIIPFTAAAQPAAKPKLVVVIVADQFRYDYLLRFRNDHKEGLDRLRTRGAAFAYDAHVPLILMGSGIKAGTVYERVSQNNIAPTLSALLGIEFPSGSTGRILSEIFSPAGR
jgi:predicted AlkP superfamily pyrophosphatase or phosphodiesterase